MSLSAAHASKLTRRNCRRCHERKARFAYRGEVRADRDHVLCFACYRSERESRRARLLAEVTGTRAPALRAPFDSPLSPQQIAHRRRMLAHLRAGRVEG